MGMTSGMGPLKRLAAWLSDLRLAIVLLLLIALASAVGTGIPQGDPPSSYIDAYADTPWLGLLHGEQVLQLQLCLLYTSPSPRDRQKSRMPSSA